MLRMPLVQSQSLTNNGHTYQSIPLFNQRSNEGTGLSDARAINGNGVIKKGVREPTNNVPLPNLPSSTSGFELNQISIQSRPSESSLAASVALVQQNSLIKSAFEPPSSSHENVPPHQVNGGNHMSEASQHYVNHSECRSKYDRLLEAHRKLQRTNGALEGIKIISCN